MPVCSVDTRARTGLQVYHPVNQRVSFHREIQIKQWDMSLGNGFMAATVPQSIFTIARCRALVACNVMVGADDLAYETRGGQWNELPVLMRQ